jgi:hypothetical protein
MTQAMPKPKPTANAARQRRFRNRVKQKQIVLPPLTVPRGLIDGLLHHGPDRAALTEAAARLLVGAYQQKYK